MKMRMVAVLLALAALAPQAANAQTANRNPQGARYCFTRDVYLLETKSGMEASLHFQYSGNIPGTLYPAGVRPWLSQSAPAYIKVTYTIPFDRAGKPIGRPKPAEIQAAAGEFVQPRGKRPLLTLQIKAAAVLTPPIFVNPNQMYTDEVGVRLSAAAGTDPDNAQMPQAKLYQLALGIEQGPSEILLSEGGKLRARVPILQQSMVAERQAAFAWLQKTTPLLAAGKCG